MTYNFIRGILNLRILILVCILFTLMSCSQKSSEKIDDAVDVALTYLSDEKCDAAIDILEDVGRDRTNAIYLQVLASAYACRAGYNEVRFLSDDITRVSGTTLMTSLTTLTLSPETEADSQSYEDLREALNVLLHVDSNQPSQSRRTEIFGPRKAGDLGIQALFLSLTQLGRYLHFYGNVNSAGAKGEGLPNVDEQTSSVSKCFAEYTSTQALALITAGEGGACTNGNFVGHPDLSFQVADMEVTKRRMCEGLMLITNVLDILNNLTLPNDPSMGDISDVGSSVNAAKALIIGINPALEVLLETTSQATCESLVANSAEFNNLQDIYAALFEKGLP